jgi:hypothetical protein
VIERHIYIVARKLFINSVTFTPIMPLALGLTAITNEPMKIWHEKFCMEVGCKHSFIHGSTVLCRALASSSVS